MQRRLFLEGNNEPVTWKQSLEAHLFETTTTATSYPKTKGNLLCYVRSQGYTVMTKGKYPVKAI